MILQIKLTNIDGDVFSINLEDVSVVKYADTTQDVERQRDVIVLRNRNQPMVTLPGAYLDAIAALKAEYNTSPKASDYLIIGTTP